MKKAIVLLLVLAVLGGAVFAQVTVGVTASGGVTLFDQDTMATFARDGAAYDLLTFKASKDKTSVAFTVDNFDSYTTAANFVFRDWYFATANDMVKIILGKPRNGDFRAAMDHGWYADVGSTYRFFGGASYGAIVESTGLGALTLGLGLGIPEAGVDSVDMLEKANLAVKYDIADVGTIKALAMLDLTGNTGAVQTIGASFGYTGMENLSATLYTRAILGDDNQFYVAGSAYYTMDKLYLGFEAEYLSNWGGVDAPSVGAKVAYNVTDPLSVFVKAGYKTDETMHFWGGVDYDFIPGLTAEFEAGSKAGDVMYDLSVYYSYSF